MARPRPSRKPTGLRIAAHGLSSAPTRALITAWAACLLCTAVAASPPHSAGPDPLALGDDPADSKQGFGDYEGPHRFRHDGRLALRHNPLGLSLRYDAGYRYRLFDSDSILLESSYVGAAMILRLSPSYGKAGIILEAEPLAVLRVSAAYEAIGYFGSFDQLRSYSGPGAYYFDSSSPESSPGYATFGHRLALVATLQAKVGPLAIRNTGGAMYYGMRLREGDTVFYNTTLDILISNSGWVLTNDIDLLWLGSRRLIAGLRHSYIMSLHGENLGHTSLSRVGPVAVLQLTEDAPGPFSKPSLLFLTGWWLKHPYRSGQEVSALMPYVVVAFSFSGDLF